MEVYNKVLKVDGEHLMIIHVGGGYTEMKIDVFQEEIRPLLYDKLHLINSNVSKLLKVIDYKIAECKFNEEVETHDEVFLAKSYSDLIKSIREHIDEFRHS